MLNPTRLRARQPAGQCAEQLARAREPLQHPRTVQQSVPAGRTASLRSVRRRGRGFAHRSISMPCPAESVEKIGGHAHLQRRSFDGNTPRLSPPTPHTPSAYLPQRPHDHAQNHLISTANTGCLAHFRRPTPESFRSRRSRSGRLNGSQEVDENDGCQIRTTALVCPTATATSRSGSKTRSVLLAPRYAPFTASETGLTSEVGLSRGMPAKRRFIPSTQRHARSLSLPSSVWKRPREMRMPRSPPL